MKPDVSVFLSNKTATWFSHRRPNVSPSVGTNKPLTKLYHFEKELVSFLFSAEPIRFHDAAESFTS
jgi:hypothetical protein